MRFNITLKLMIFASLLLAIPVIGYNYIWDMEKYLRKGQEQTLMGNAQALATALHERPNLFNKHASYKDSLEKGKDFFPTKITSSIRLDGLDNDWDELQTSRSTNFYNHTNQITTPLLPEQVSLSFSAEIGRYQNYVYAFFKVKDDKVKFRQANVLSVTDNDHLEIATINAEQQLVRFVISNHKTGWISAFRMPQFDGDDKFPSNEPSINGNWQLTADGYNLEIRIPAKLLGEKVGFNITDIDDYKQSTIPVTIGTSDTKDSQDLGTLTVPSPNIERIIKAMGRSHSKIWVIDKHQRIMTQQGDIHSASGDWSSNQFYATDTSWFSQFRQWLIAPFYKYFLTKPPKDFLSQQFANRQQKNSHINHALNQGGIASTWWTTPDNKAVILSAAHPIYVDGKIEGAVIVEETTHGIRNIRNQAVEGVLLTSIFIFCSVLALLLYTLRLSYRIRKLRNQTDSVIDENGRIKAQLPATNINDEIGDLSKSFTTILHQLGQYNDYLQNMSSRLSHELKTPISVVRSSLEMIENQQLPEASQIYMDRAKKGIHRLNAMLMAMSEASHLEQALQTSDKETFDLAQLVEGCSQSYMQVYKPQTFNLNIADKPLLITGCDEHIAQLFDKLISNAVEFSQPDQNITIALRQQKNVAILTVTNHGALLPDEMSNNIFDAMVSVRDEDHKQQPHLGIGLYISRLICDYHQGSISAANLNDGSGVKFTVTLPIN
ncbi:proteobacterial dedicated sortase system histidine kinase [Colwelliaceae bacterium BS250]